MKYIDADRLLAEIDRIEEEARTIRVSGTDKEAIGADSKVKLCLKLKSIINSLQQEQPEVDLEIERIVKDEEKFMNFQARHQLIGYVARHFAQWGAEHAREQMMKEAVEGEVVSTSDNGWECIRIYKKLHKCDDKVKLIIVKED